MRQGSRVKLTALLAAALVSGAAAPPDSPVADAARRGDVEAVRTLLRQGADVNAAHADGMSALHWAADAGNLELAQMLGYAGANVDAVTRLGGYTPLHLAAKAGHDRVVTALLEAGADPEAATTAGGARPLHFAAAAGSVAAVRVLLDHGAEVDAREAAWGQTPLMWAAAYDQLAVIEALLERGAGVGRASHVMDVAARETADREAERRRRERLAALRALEREAEQPDSAGPAELRLAAAGEQKQQQAGEEKERAAGRAGAQKGKADKAEAGEKGGAAAADSSKVKADAPKADSAKAKPDAAGADSAMTKPPAEPADEPEDAPPEAAEPLSYGQLVGGKGGLTPLLFAARQGHTAAVLALLDAGAPIDQVSEGDHTSPLLMAVINGHFDLAMLLLQRGADPNQASDAGATPLFAAINAQWAPKALYPQPTAYQQQRSTYLELIEALLEAGADPNVRLKKHLWYMSYNFDLLGVNTAGATPFWRAAYATDVPAMTLLVAHGADPNIPTEKVPERRRRRGSSGEESEKDHSGLPPVPVGGPAVWPIHAASGVGYGEGYAANAHRHAPDGWLPAVKYLVEELGADVNARDHNGYNPVHHAAARGDNELISYLVEKGADVTAVSRKGQTTADMANGPVQRVPPFPATIELLVGLGSKNNDKCLSC